MSLKGGVLTGVLAWLLAFYIFDAAYPSQYEMLLATLQTFVVGETYTRLTLQSFKFFTKKLQPVYQAVATEEVSQQ